MKMYTTTVTIISFYSDRKIAPSEVLSTRAIHYHHCEKSADWQAILVIFLVGFVSFESSVILCVCVWVLVPHVLAIIS